MSKGATYCPGDSAATRHPPKAAEGEAHAVCLLVTIDPENRDESLARLKEHGVVEPEGLRLLGAWISLTQQETWSIFEADDAAAIMKLFEPWANINVHHIAPVMSFDELKKVVG